MDILSAQQMSPAERAELARELLRLNRPKAEGTRRALGRWLKRERKRLGMSQEGLAQRVGLGRPALANYEAGKQSCSMDMFLQLCAELETDPAEALEEVLHWPA